MLLFYQQKTNLIIRIPKGFFWCMLNHLTISPRRSFVLEISIRLSTIFFFFFTFLLCLQKLTKSITTVSYGALYWQTYQFIVTLSSSILFCLIALQTVAISRLLAMRYQVLWFSRQLKDLMKHRFRVKLLEPEIELSILHGV